MIQHHKWSLTEIEDMLPYERTLYSELLVQWENEENARIEKERLQEEARLAEIESRIINFQLTKGTEAVGMTTLGLSPFIIGGAVLYLMSRKGKKK